MKAMGLEYVPLDQLLAESDIISLHLPLMPETYHMVGAQSFGLSLSLLHSLSSSLSLTHTHSLSFSLSHTHSHTHTLTHTHTLSLSLYLSLSQVLDLLERYGEDISTKQSQKNSEILKLLKLENNRR